jgi:hypothetical protein
MRSSGPLAEVTVPLTPETSYEEFVAGLKPFARKAQPPGVVHGANESPTDQRFIGKHENF